MLSLNFVLSFIGIAVALLIGLLLFSSTTDVINEGIQEIEDPVIKQEATEQVEENSTILWTVIGLLPILLFFVLFAVFGALGGGVFDGIVGRRDSHDQDDKVPGSQKQSYSLPKWLCLEFLWLIGLAKKRDDKENLK